MRLGGGAAEGFRVEARADAVDQFGRVEIEMDLAVAHR